MKRIVVLLIALALTGCMQTPPPTLIPVDTIVAMTMAAIPRTETPTPSPTETPVPVGQIEEISSASGPALTAAGAQCIPTNTERYQARLIRVIDGDTIEVALGNNAVQVRYIGVNAPDVTALSERFGLEAKAENKSLIGDQMITLIKDTSDIDAEGHLMRYVLVGNLFVNYELVRQGYAISALAPPDLACQEIFLSAENEARILGAGMWAPTPLPSVTLTFTPSPTPIGGIPTKTPSIPCDCEGHQLRCKDFDTHAEAQACYNYCVNEGYGDIFGLDKDGTGRVCKGLP
jgi:endonuclease YncB( thermonuclease family)